MSLADAFAGAEVHYRAEVYAATWGHLAPQPRQTYRGWILFAHSAYGGETCLINADFGDLDDSPWLYEDLQEYVEHHREVLPNNEREGNVYRFDGTYTKFKNGGCRFSGKVRQLPTGGVKT